MPAPTTPPRGPARPPRPRTKGRTAVSSARTPSAGAPSAVKPAPVRAGSPPARSPIRRLWSWLEGDPETGGGVSYYMILGSSVALTLIGLLMVLSSSAVEAITKETSSYDLFMRQGIWALAGFVLMVVMARLPVDTIRRLAWPALGLAVLLLLLVFTPLGVEVYGNRNWIRIGGFSGQPSEAAKLALAVWAAAVLERKSHMISNWRHAVVPVVFPLGGLVVLLVLLGRDLGTALVLLLILGTTIFLAGAPLRMFGVALGGAASLALLMVAVSGNRMTRIYAWLRLNCDSATDPCYQSEQGLYALASGGWWGLGLGQSRQKWNYIPEAENDFIFAIIGEELGLVGTIVIIALFGLLAVAMYRVAARSHDRFVRVATGGIMVWLIGQAFINIGMVTNVLPVVGVPLPFISYGGSALTFALTAVGVVLAFARQGPGAPPVRQGPLSRALARTRGSLDQARRAPSA
ncbi:putative lipid II flippase FtsW [Arthrobacter ginkgonis]|uniref:Probable peptidoglycan glycosyltransferase FtsW n=1 Tax=Arthrobacter ginkgonis TaxID=1630594 RepID=A0ABP7CA62_9MICC